MSLQTDTGLKTLARRAPADWVMGGLGLGCAAASAGFAIYMVAVGPGAADPHGSGYFTVFAHFDRRPQYAALRDEMGISPADAITSKRGTADAPASPVATSVAARADAVDYTATGSILAAPVRLEGAPRGEPVLRDFTVRDVFDGKALVEGRHALTLVAPGVVLEGAGEVLSIQRRNDAWVVVTRNGVIGGQIGPQAR